MKILMITQDFPPVRGGIQSYCYELAQALHQQGAQLTVICPDHPEQSDSDWPFEVIRLSSHTSFLFLKLLGFLPSFFKNRSFDQIILGQWQNAIGLQFAWPKSTPVHSMVHGRELLDGVFKGLTPWICRRFYNKMQSVIPNSHPVAELFQQTLQGVKAPQIQVIHPGVDPHKFRPCDKQAVRAKYGLEGKALMVSITRLVARKNIALGMRALPQILEQVPNAHYVIGGRGPELERLQELRVELGLQEHITILGSIPEEDIVDCFGMGDVFILPSSQSSKDVEGFGIVFLEAGACEVAVIGANTGGIRDAVPHGQSGILLDDLTEEALAQAVVQVIQDPQRAQEMGEFARQRILSELTWSQCGQSYLEHFAKF